MGRTGRTVALASVLAVALAASSTGAGKLHKEILDRAITLNRTGRWAEARDLVSGLFDDLGRRWHAVVEVNEEGGFAEACRR